MNNNLDSFNYNSQRNENNQNLSHSRFFQNTNQIQNNSSQNAIPNNQNNLNQSFNNPTPNFDNNIKENNQIENSINIFSSNNPQNIISPNESFIAQNNLNQNFTQQNNNIQDVASNSQPYIQNDFNTTTNNFNQQPTKNIQNEDTLILNTDKNRFINNNISIGNTTLNDLNVDGTYNNMQINDYSMEPRVQENLKKKNTITINSEGKIFILIIIVLLLFIFVMPYIFDAIRNASH